MPLDQLSRNTPIVSRASRTTWDAIRAAGRLPQDAHLLALAEGLLSGSTITPTQIAAPGEPVRTRHAAMARALLDACVRACTAMRPEHASASLLDRLPGLGDARVRERTRRIRATLHAAAMAWSTLPEQERLVIAELARGSWAGAVEELLTDPRPAVRGSLALLARESVDPALADAVATLIGDASQDVSESAERALVSLAASAPDDPQVRMAIATVASRVAAHQRRGAMLAFAAIADRVSMRVGAAEPWAATARAILRDERSGAGERGATGAGAGARADANGANEAIRALLRFSRTTAASARAVEWLKIASVSRACVDRLSRPRVRSDHAALLANGHLLEHPARASALRGVKVPAIKAARKGESAILPLDVSEYEEDARAQVPRVAAVLKGADADLAQWLEPLLTDSSARVRLSLARHAPLALRRDLIHDAHPLVARAAAVRMSLAGTLGEVRVRGRGDVSFGEAMEPFLAAHRSPHALVRAIARDERASFTPMGVAWRLGWRKRLGTDPDACLGQVAAMLRQAGTALDEGIELVRALNLTTRLHEAMGEAMLGGKASPRQAATIVALLGQADPARSLRAGAAISEALVHEDARVRSNAIEAIAHRARHASASASPVAMECVADENLPTRLARLVEDAHHRVRSTLAKAVLLRAFEIQVPRASDDGQSHPFARELEGASAGDRTPNDAGARAAQEITPKVAQAVLTDMLTAEQPLDRLAGVWAAGRVVLATSRASASPQGLSAGAPVLQARLAEIARFDIEPKVRWRASCVIERLEGDIRAAWSVPASGPASVTGPGPEPVAARGNLEGATP